MEGREKKKSASPIFIPFLQIPFPPPSPPLSKFSWRQKKMIAKWNVLATAWAIAATSTTAAAAYTASPIYQQVVAFHDYATAHYTLWQSANAVNEEQNKYLALRTAFDEGTLLCEVAMRDSNRLVTSMECGKGTAAKLAKFRAKTGCEHVIGDVGSFIKTLDLVAPEIPKSNAAVPTSNDEAALTEFLASERGYINEIFALEDPALMPLYHMHIHNLLVVEGAMHKDSEDEKILAYFRGISGTATAWDMYGKEAAARGLAFVARHLMLYSEFLRNFTRARPWCGGYLTERPRMHAFVMAVDASFKAFADWRLLVNAHLLQVAGSLDRRVFRIDPVTLTWGVGTGDSSFFALLTPLHVIIAQRESPGREELRIVEWFDVSVVQVSRPAQRQTPIAQRTLTLKDGGTRTRTLLFETADVKSIWAAKLA
jgi:hypothetical protein